MRRLDNFTLAMGAVAVVYALGIVQMIEALARYSLIHRFYGKHYHISVNRVNRQIVFFVKLNDNA